jgi:hypothetical protein
MRKNREEKNQAQDKHEETRGLFHDFIPGFYLSSG